MHVESTQISAACLGIGTVILVIKCSLNVYSCSDFRLLALVIRRTCLPVPNGLLNILLLKATKFPCFL